ncbi:MAG: peptidoglycan editing factor PgeF [Candidatus Obscuribacterales bacterium]|nr:peptidoglycan editing factor PgeF [Steroidobacteraceae bacterium]
MNKLAFIRPNWPVPANVHAASTFREGGVSRGPYDNFNLATHVGDDVQAVADNRQRLGALLQLPGEPCWLDQVHGDAVVEASSRSQPARADACVARSADLVCAVLTADCLPVLFSSRDGDRVAAAHAGWRGLAGGVLDTTVSSLNLPGSELTAWLGPAIGQHAFEVGDDVRVAFLARDAGSADAFAPNKRGRWQCDLYALARRNLHRLGVREIYGGGYCTYTDTDNFFSFRRDGQCGRMATMVWRE